MIFLGDVVVAMILAAAIWLTGLRIHTPANISIAEREISMATALAGLIAATFFVIIVTRNFAFGVDTLTYANIFQSYCTGADLSGLEFSFRLTSVALNAAMLGACDVRLLPLAWLICIVAGLLTVKGSARFKLVFATTLAISLVGIELATNALRQSLSVVLLAAAVSRSRQPFFAIVLSAAALFFHTSAALVIAAWISSRLGWRSFLATGLLAVAAAAGLVVTGAGADLPIEPLIYEITKYLDHPADEALVRLLAALTVVVAFVAALIGASSRTVARQFLKRPDVQQALKLAVSCLPFLILPYFGYRYIYGIYPVIVLLLLRATVDSDSGHTGRTVMLMMAANMIGLLGWSLSSSYMQSVPIYG